MARFVKDESGGLKQVARFDSSLMMSTSNIFPNNTELSSKFIVKKDTTMVGKPSRWYNVESNSALVRKIFKFCMKVIIDDIIDGNCKFVLPNNTTASIYMGKLPKQTVLHRCRDGRNPFDLISTNREMPGLYYRIGANSRRKLLKVYVSPDRYQRIIDRANTGELFSQRPRGLDYFLDRVYKEFDLLDEKCIRKSLLHCFKKMSYYLKRDEELRFVDKTGEIRFYRQLGKKHDEVMRSVVNKRKFRERKLKENE